MIPYLGCHSARVILEAFHDAELPVDEQVALDAHLRWCETCRARVEDFRLIGQVLRAGSARPMVAADEGTLAGAQALARIEAERTESFAVRWREMWVDSRFLWPAFGATVALLLCLTSVAAVFGVMRAENPNSLAGLIAGRSALPAPHPPLPSQPAPAVAPEGEAVFLLSAAVVNGGGRVATYELLQSEREPAAEVRALADALRDMRFAPSTPRGVVVVWLVARTTVRGSVEPAERPLSDGARPAPRPARS
jgi:hypothetical protein